MKKSFLLIILLALLAITKVNAFTVAQIHVQVNNSQTGLSIASHQVIITDSAAYTHTYYTNPYGQFSDSIYNPATTPVKYYIITYDCNNVMHYDTVTTYGWAYKSAIFNICNMSADLGIVSILNPCDTSFFSGVLFNPEVKVVKFSTSIVNSIHYGYSINGQAPIINTWYGSSTMILDTIYISLPAFVIPSTNFTFCAFLMNTDSNSANDTLCKTVVIANPYKDAGVVEVIAPSSSVVAGDSIAPVIKIKNYGTNTLTSVNIGYRPNDWGQFIIETWTGTLPMNSTANFTFNQKFKVETALDLHFEAYTFLTGDQNWYNDSALKILPINPPNYDAGIIDIISPANTVCAGTHVYPKVIIKNFGQNQLNTIPIVYKSGATGTLVTYTWSSTTPLNSGDTISFTFPNYYIMPVGYSIAFSAYTNLLNDANILNDKISKVITITQIPNSNFNINGDDTIVAGQSNVMYQTSNPQIGQYVWTLPPGAFLDSVYNNFIIVHFANNAQSGNITCKVINQCGTSSTVVFPVYVYTTPPPPIISLGANNTLYSGYSTGNQWYFENNAIPGATSQSYTATQTGHYYCKVSINGNTSAQSNTIYIGFSGVDESYVKTDFEVYPNPASDKLFFRYMIDKSGAVELKITDMEGRCVKSIIHSNQTAGEYKYEIDISGMPKGFYFYQFSCGQSVLSGKLILVK